MTDTSSAAATNGQEAESPAAASADGGAAEIRRQREDARRSGDRETAQMLDALEREIYDAEEKEGRPDSAMPDPGGVTEFTEGDHAPLSRDDAVGVFTFLDEVDPEAAASLRREWGGDAAANLGYAHLWFTTQYTQAERDSMVVTPGLVSMAARMGRKLSADGRESRLRRQDEDHGAGNATGSRNEPVEIRRLKEESQRNGDHRLAQQYDEQERAAYARLDGAGPIVGRAGRKM
jgi:hypothetical protein